MRARRDVHAVAVRVKWTYVEENESVQPQPRRAEQSARVGIVMVDGIPESDPAYPIVEAILNVVPASRWAFARMNADGDLERLLASSGSRAGKLEELESEFRRQRVVAKTGPRIAAALGSMSDVESGVTLLFADSRTTFGILTLLRTSDLGSFTSAEIGMLTLALAATSERLSSLRIAPQDEPARTRSRGEPPASRTTDSASSFYVLDRDLQIVLAWNADDQRRIAMTGLHTRIADRLPAVLEETVRELTADWDADPERREAGIARPVPFLVVRTDPLTGPTGLFIGVRIDRFRPPNSLASATTRFHITPREVQVLALLLDGERLSEIGTRLHITSSTVQDHIRSMVEKTGSRNRSDLIARVLGWEFAADSA